jgi:chromosome segregation ATPase
MTRALLLFMLSLPLFAQTSSTDAALTQALLTEIRGLRQDLQVTAATIQRVQIIMYRLQAQTALMNRVTQRLDDARNRCTQAQNQNKMFTTEIQRAEDRLRTSQNPTEQKQLQDQIARFKSQIEMFSSEEQQCRVRESEADANYRSERAKMAELEDQLDKLDKVLAGVK